MKYRIINKITNKIMAEFPGDQKNQAANKLRRIVRDNRPDPFVVVEVARVGSTEVSKEDVK
jgi:hypothetical protein